MKKIIFIIIVFAAFLSCNKNAQKVTIRELTCEYTGNPLGIDVEQPRFSWNIVSGKRDIYQQSYQIIVNKCLKGVLLDISDKATPPGFGSEIYRRRTRKGD